MFKKVKMKQLAIVFILLLTIVAVIEFFDFNSGEKTFKSELVSIDSALISGIMIYNKTDKNGIRLSRKNNEWYVASKEKSFSADKNLVHSLIESVRNIKAERVASKDKSKWTEYEVSDTSGTKIRIETDGGKTTEFIVGKFSYKQSNYGFLMFYYFRFPGENEVYSVQGQLNMIVNRDLNSFRDKVIVSENKNHFRKLKFSYPGDSSFVLEKHGGSWFLNGSEADSAKVIAYLTVFENLSGNMFAEDNNTASVSPIFSVNAEGINMKTFNIHAIPSDTINKFIVYSDIKPDYKFYSGTTRLAERIFVSSKTFKLEDLSLKK